MEWNDLAIATICWARDTEEENVLRNSLQSLSDLVSHLGVPVYITDGGSSPAFLSFLQQLPGIVTLSPAKGLWAQAFCSLSAASTRPFILYTEPDKADFFQSHLEHFVSAATISSGIILAARDEESFKTFPPFQQFTETTINGCCKEITGQAADHTYGPFLLRSDLVPAFNSLPEDIGWGWRTYAFAFLCTIR